MRGYLMRLQLPINHGTRVAVLTAMIAALAGTAMAQQKPVIPEVRVVSTGAITKQLGRTSSGALIESAEVTMRVSYADLSLDTNSGQALLKARVKDAAKEACKRASTYYPLSMLQTSDDTCVAVAVKGAKPQINSIIAAANTPKRAAPEAVHPGQPVR